jgi:hypothetical protein
VLELHHLTLMTQQHIHTGQQLVQVRVQMLLLLLLLLMLMLLRVGLLLLRLLPTVMLLPLQVLGGHSLCLQAVSAHTETHPAAAATAAAAGAPAAHNPYCLQQQHCGQLR